MKNPHEKICCRKETCVHPDGPELLLKEFTPDKRKSSGLKSECRACHNKSNKLWREANKDKSALYIKEWRKVNHEKTLAYKTEYRVNNKEKVAAYAKQWEIANKEKRYAQVAGYRASRLNQTPIWSDPLAIEKIYKDCIEINLAARTAGCPPYIQYEVDHIIPLQSKLVSGLHTHTNLRIILRSENRKKHNSFIPG